MSTTTHTFNVRDFGAIGDGHSLDTQAIQSAIDACHEAGGGTVQIPAGTYRAGTLLLTSNLTLRLEPDAVLLVSRNMSDYVAVDQYSYVRHLDSHFAFLHGLKVNNVSITGGRIDGNAALDPGEPTNRGPICINFEQSQNITIEDVTVVDNAGGATVNFFACRHIVLRAFEDCNSFAGGPNFSCCQDVLIDDVLVDGAQDDPICIKNDSVGYCYDTVPPCGFLSENIVVQNAVVRNTDHGAVKIGTGSFGVFRNIQVTDSVFENITEMFRIQLFRPKLKQTPRRAIEDVVFSNITMKDVPRLVNWGTNDVAAPVIRNISMRDITCQGAALPSIMDGLAEAPIRDVTFTNVQVSFEATGEPVAQWLAARHVQGMKFSNVQLRCGGRVQRAVLAEHCKDFEWKAVHITDIHKSGPVVSLNDIQGAAIRDTQSPTVGTFVSVQGSDTAGISLAGNDLRQAGRPVDASEAVPTGAISPVADNIEFRDLQVNTPINAHERFEIRLTVTNHGEAGALKVEARVDDRMDGAQWLWLGTKESQTLTMFTSRYYAPKQYEIKVGPLTTTATVQPSPPAFVLDDMMNISLPVEADEPTQIVVTARNIGGKRGTHKIITHVDDQPAGTANVTLDPGAEQAVIIKPVVATRPARQIRVGDLSPCPLSTFTHGTINLSTDGNEIVIETGGVREADAYGAVFLNSVDGDFVATVQLLALDDIANQCLLQAGLMATNDAARMADEPARTALDVVVLPPFGNVRHLANIDGIGANCGAAQFYSYPLWLKLEKRQNTFTGYVSADGTLWHKPQSCSGPDEITNEGVFTIAGARPVQQVGVYGRCVDTRDGEIRRQRFAGLCVRQPVALEAIRYGDIQINKTRVGLDEPFTASCNVTNTGPDTGPVKVGLYIDHHEPYTQWIDLAPGESQPVVFTAIPSLINTKTAIPQKCVGREFWLAPRDVSIGSETNRTPPVSVEVSAGAPVHEL